MTEEEHMITFSNVMLFRLGIIIAVISLLSIIISFIIYKFKNLQLQRAFDEEYGKGSKSKTKG